MKELQTIDTKEKELASYQAILVDQKGLQFFLRTVASMTPKVHLVEPQNSFERNCFNHGLKLSKSESGCSSAAGHDYFNKTYITNTLQTATE
jgi:hypothetical protein